MSEKPQSEMPAVRCRGLSHVFGRHEYRLAVLRDVDLTVPPGELVVLTGPSGSGKSTLLGLIAGQIVVQQGSLQVIGIEMAGLAHRQLREVRRQVGFFSPVLIASLSVGHNVALALGHQRLTASQRLERVMQVLQMVDLGERAGYRPQQLSGGQHVRVAIARAIVHRPRLIVADEPTAALDSQSSATVVNLLKQLAQGGSAIFVVTHDSRFMQQADRIVDMKDGRIASDVRVDERRS